MPRLRFPSAVRLSRTHEFARLKQEGRTFQGRLLVLSVLAVGGPAPSRFGLITSRRVGGAVPRNRVRRQLREIIRAVRPRLHAGFWVVFIARARAVEAGFSALREDALQLLGRGSVLPLPCS